jgi:hypothetical protein
MNTFGEPCYCSAGGKDSVQVGDRGGDRVVASRDEVFNPPSEPLAPSLLARESRGGDTALRELARNRRWWLAGAVTAAYATIIIIGAAHHEVWRDEIVPLSIARGMPSFLDLWQIMRHEGHPLLWYVILRYAYFVFGSTGVLPVLSVLIAIAAILLFVSRAPLPLWMKCLFVFGYLPIFEYSVVARANGLAMLLLFAFCALYADREKHPVGVAVILATLANTTSQGFVTAGAAGIMIAIDAVMAKGRGGLTTGRYLFASAVYVAGLAHALASNAPDTSVVSLELFHHHDWNKVIPAVWGAIVSPAAHSAPLLWVPFTALWLWLAVVLLWRRPALAVFLLGSLVGFELIFTLLYPANPRHMGYVVLVIIATVWLWNPWDRRDALPVGGPVSRLEAWMRRLLLVPLTATLCYQVIIGIGYVVDDVRLEYSSSGRLAALIASDPRLERAIVISEPENLILSLPYYRDNKIFLPQENAFRDWLFIWIPGGRRGDYNLAELLVTSTALRQRHDTPVVMALGWRLDGPDVQRTYSGTYFEQTFSMSAVDRAEFLARTRLLGRLREASFTDENYDVFVLW